MDNKILEWKRRQAEAANEARQINQLRATRDLTDDEGKKLGELSAEVGRLQETIETEERMQLRSADTGGSVQAPIIGMADKELKEFSLVRAIQAQATGDWRRAGLEREASDATAKRINRDAQGFFLPYDWLRSEYSGVEKRAITGVTGASLVPTAKLGFIERLRNRMMVRAAGALVLDGLIGNVDLPKRTVGASLSWVAPGSAPGGEATQTFDAVPMRPKTGSAYIDIYRTMFNQTSLDIEMLVRDDLAAAVQLGLDYVALHGDGQNNAPTGIASTSGIGLVYAGNAATNLVNANGAAMVWNDVVRLETEVAIDNADIGSLGYMTNANVRGALKTTSRVAGQDKMIWDSDGQVNGYQPWITNQVRGNITKGGSTDLNAMFFGNWSDLVIGLWGVIDITADIPDNRTGTVRVAAIIETDIGLRQAASFAACLDIKTS